MKKNTALLLALSFSSVCLSFSACGGGDDPDGNIEGNACTVSVCSSDGKSLFKCDPETGAAKRVSCAKGCSVGKCNGDSPVGSECASDSDCKDASKPVCKNSMCVASESAKLGCSADSDCKDASKPVCKNSMCVASESVKLGCSADSDCKDASKPVCKNSMCVASESAKLGCSADSDCKDASKPVCKNNMCVAAEAVSYACKGVTCADGTCDRGVCVTDAMKKAKAGDECGADFADFCSGNSAVYCGDFDKVVVSDCSSDGGCSLIIEEYDGEIYLLPYCKGPAEICTSEGDIPYCVTESSPTGSISYESFYMCVKNTEGGLTAIDLGYSDMDACPASCNADRTACADE